MDPTGDNKLSLPELGVTVALLEHETWEREAHMTSTKWWLKITNEIKTAFSDKQRWMKWKYVKIEQWNVKIKEKKACMINMK